MTASAYDSARIRPRIALYSALFFQNSTQTPSDAALCAACKSDVRPMLPPLFLRPLDLGPADSAYYFGLENSNGIRG